MEINNSELLKRKAIDLLNLFSFQNDYKYRFRPDVFSFMMNTCDKKTNYSPKSLKYFKKLLKVKNKNLKIKSSCKYNVNKNKFFNLKKIKNQNEQNVYDNLQEVAIIEKIKILKKQGIWTRDCLPKVMEPKRLFCHWDYLCREMEWISIDLNNRFAWKIAAAKILAESARQYVIVKEEINRLECIQLQHTSRFHCSIIAKMIKDFWITKETQKLISNSNSYSKIKLDAGNEAMDYCQIWLSENLINTITNNVYEVNNISDSESLCSFGSGIKSLITNGEEWTNSCHDSDFEYIDDVNNYEELLEELSWLENNIDNSYNFETEIDELNALSQLPLEDIIDESYFLSDMSLSSHSNSLDNSSIHSQDEIFENFTNIQNTQNVISINTNKLTSVLKILNNCINSSNDTEVDRYLKNYLIKQNIQLLFNLMNNDITFTLFSQSHCGDDRFLIAVLFGYMLQINNLNMPILIITTISTIFEWVKLFSIICSKMNVMILDSYDSGSLSNEHLLKLNANGTTLCVASYSAMSRFSVHNIKWNTIIYDKFDLYCQSSRNEVDNNFLNNINSRIKIALLSDYNDTFNDFNALELFFKTLYNPIIYYNFFQDLELPIKPNNSALIDKLKKVVTKHIVPLANICDFEGSYRIIMCELTPIQQSFHDFIIDKLKRSLDSSSLIDFIEVVSQDIQISQHPLLFDYSSNDLDKRIYDQNIKSSFNKKNDSDYSYSSFEAIECYIPQCLFLFLKGNINNESFIVFNNYVLPFHFKHLTYLNLNKVERFELIDLLVSSKNVDMDVNYNNNSNELDNSSYLVESVPFLSSNDIKCILSDHLNLNNSSILQNDNTHINFNIIPEKNCNNSFDLCNKNNLTQLLKENEKFCPLLSLDDCCYPSIRKTVILDLNININELTVLQKLSSITKDCMDAMILKYRFLNKKVKAVSPILKSSQGKSTGFIDSKRLYSITSFYRSYFKYMPQSNQILFNTNKKDLFMSGKLQTLNHMFRAMAKDSLSTKCIVISHSFNFLNMIESMLFLHNNYTVFKRLRISSSIKEDKNSFSIINYFNNCHVRKRKVILLLHSKCESIITDSIDASFSSIILTDSHWQTDSNLLIKNLIKRWSLKCIISNTSISSIYRLCSFGSLEQFFLTHDLSFMYYNSYVNKNLTNSLSGAIICQQSLLKNFFDKLPSPLKEELMSGFYLDNFQGLLKTNENFIKISKNSVSEILNSFEDPYDLVLNCHYQSLQKLECYELNHSSDIIKNKPFNFPKQLYFITNNAERVESIRDNKEINIKNWELCRIQRSKRLNVRNFVDYKNIPIFYNLKDMENVDKIWMPPSIDDYGRYFPSEIRYMYESEPIPEADLPTHLLPPKLYQIKDTGRINQEKNIISSKVTDDILKIETNYIDIERIKKRKLSTETYKSEENQYTSNIQKKRKMLVNRRYYGENEIELHNNHSHIKSRIRLERSNDALDLKESTDLIIKKQPLEDVENINIDHDIIQYQSGTPPVSSNPSVISSQVSEGNRFNSIIIGAGSTKLNLQRPFYSRESWKALKSKRQHVSATNVLNPNSKTNFVPAGNQQSILGQQRLLYNRGQLSLNTKFGNQTEPVSQSTSDNDYEKLPEWNLNEEAVLYQNITQYQDCQILSIDKALFGPNYKLSEYYISFFAISSSYRSNETCKIHFEKLQVGNTNQNNFVTTLSRNNKNQILTNPVISGVAGRKLKIKMKNSIGTYGTSNIGNSQGCTSKIKMFQYFMNDMKVNLLQTSQIVNSTINSFENMVSVTSKMLDEVVNKSRLPSLLLNHSQTIKKNATHMNALEEHGIHPDKIFTPAMLIQRREDLDKDTESVHATSNLNRQHSITSVSSNYRSPAYFDGSQLNTSSHPLNHIRRSASTNVGNSQNIYSIPTPIVNQVRARYNLPINRQMSSSSVSGISQSSISGMSNSLSTQSLSQNQIASIGSRNQIQHIQVQQHPRNSAAPSHRRVPNQPQVMSKLVPYNGNYQFVRQNPLGSRQTNTSFARPIVPNILNQSNTQITVFPSSNDQSGNLTMINNTRQLDRTVNVSMGTQLRGQSIRTAMPIVSSSNRGNIIGTIPRMTSVNNQLNRNTNNNNGRNLE